MINTIEFKGYTHYRCFGKFNRDPLKGETGCCVACSEENNREVELAPGIRYEVSYTPIAETWQFSEDENYMAMEFCQKHIEELEIFDGPDPYALTQDGLDDMGNPLSEYGQDDFEEENEEL